MKNLNELIDTTKLKALEHEISDNQKIIFSVSESSYCIYQRYFTLSYNECFWEAHKKFVDVHIWLKGDEIIHLSKPLINFGRLTNEKHDFWTTKESLDIENSIILNKDTPVFICPINTPHKCQIRKNNSFIEKLTLKIYTNEFDTFE